ncbi:hypothetical protein BC829DRAFT_381752 [Chytridium lagenaria]|nr:hypothetical protein BC829DRAFT_381752 [Chytridium lagenaria]
METSTTSTPSTVLSLSTTLTTNSILMECPPKPTEPCVIYDSELICRTVCLDTEQCDGIVSGKLGDVTALGSREGCAVFVNKIIKLRESPYKGFPQTTTYIKVGRFASLDGKNVTLGVGGDIEQSSTSSFQPFSSTIIVYAISSAVFLLVVVGITIFIIMKQKKSRALRSLQTNNQTNLRETSVTMTYGIQPVYQQPPSYLVQYSSQPYVPPQQVYSNPPAYTSQLYPRPGGASQRNRTYATEPAPPC